MGGRNVPSVPEPRSGTATGNDTFFLTVGTVILFRLLTTLDNDQTTNNRKKNLVGAPHHIQRLKTNLEIGRFPLETLSLLGASITFSTWIYTYICIYIDM